MSEHPPRYARSQEAGSLAKGDPMEGLSRAQLQERAELYLDSFDLKTLEDLFLEERRRSGITDDIDFKYRFTRGLGSPGEWDEATRTVELDVTEIQEDVIAKRAKLSPENDPSFEGALVSVFMHEATHGSGHNRYDHKRFNARIKSLFGTPVRVTTSGYSVTEMKSGRALEYADFFSEAVTDRIAEEKFDMYKARTGDSSLRSESYAQAYLPQRSMLESFLVLIEDITDVPRDDVWKSIKQGYFSGLDLSSSEMGKLYSEFALDTVMDGIRKVTDDQRIPEVIRDMRLAMNSAIIPEESRERIAIGLRELRQFSTRLHQRR